MSTCDRVTKLYDMLQAGAISAQEYTALKQEAVAHVAASTTAPQVGNVSDFDKIQEQMDGCSCHRVRTQAIIGDHCLC